MGPTSGLNCYVTHAIPGVPTQGDKIRIGGLTLPFRGPQAINPRVSGMPNGKRGEKVKSGCLTLAFSTTHKWAEMLRNP